MFIKLIKKFGFAIGCLAAMLVFAFVCAISWTLACGVVYLITLCFGWNFSWLIATGLWLISLLLTNIFRQGSDR